MSDYLVTPYECAQLCMALYYQPDYKWDTILYPNNDSGICMAIKRIRETNVLVYRGSETEQDWWRDGISELFRMLPPPFHILGNVALGFSEGMVHHFETVRPYLQGGSWGVTGHSLGGARAKGMAGMGVAANMGPAFVHTFGQPRFGWRTFCQIVSSVPGLILRNKGDPVAELPTCPPFDDDRPILPINEPPAAGDSWGTWAPHHMELYLAGAQKLGN